MKKLLSFLLSLLFVVASTAQVYLPADHTVSNQSYGMAQAGPTDARTYFFDINYFKYRAYQNTAEVLSYLTLSKYRTGQFDIVINTGGTLDNGVITGGTNEVWYFKDGQADGDLVLKGATVAPTLFGVEDNIAAQNRIFDLNDFALDIHTGVTSEAITFQKGVFSALAADAVTPSNRSSIQLNASAGASTAALVSEFAGGHIASFATYTDGSHSNMVLNLGADPDFRITGLPTGTTGYILYYNNTNGQTSWGAVPTSTGTVSTVSVVPANMFSGSVANASTTPAITLTLDSATLFSAYRTALNTRARLSVANTFTADQTFPNILLPATTSSTTGIIYKNSVRFMHNWTDPDIIADGDNTFLGTLAGNFTMGDAGGGGAIGGRNTGVGYHALTANTTGWQNTAIGHISQQANTTGLYNTSVGAYSLAVNTTGANNTAIGSDAMWLNQTGGANVAVGTYGMQQNTTGDNSVAIGYKALFANTTGANNIAIGSEALAAAATFSYNIAIGHNAMKNSNAISSNVAIGAFAMFAVSGSENTTVGTFGLQSITTGAGNTAIGYGANSTATTGNFGTYIGGQSAWNLTTGGRNTFIGYKSGYNADTESDNVVIGYDQRLKFDAEDGQMNIQSIIFGRGNTGSDATLSTGKIGIGVIDPQARLAVTSTTEQLRTGYDASNYESKTVSSAGVVTYNAVGASAAFTFSDPVTIPDNSVLGTPTSVTLTNATGLPISTGISGLGSGVAAFLATPSSANLITAVTDETGTGTLVFSASPTFTGTIITANIQTNATTASSNFAVISGINVATTTNTAITFAGGTSMKARVYGSGSANGALGNNEVYANWAVGATTVTGTSAGTHAGGASLLVRGFTFTPNATTPAPMTRAASIWIQDAPTGATDNFGVYSLAKFGFDATNTAGGTTGAQTINKPTGTVNFAASATSLVVTNNLVKSTSLVYAVIRTNDANATAIKSVVPASGSFTITLTTAPAAEISVGFIVYN